MQMNLRPGCSAGPPPHVEEAERAGIARDVERGVNGDLEEATGFWHRWQTEGLSFMDDHRPWERADTVVAGVGLPAAGGHRVLIAPTG